MLDSSLSQFSISYGGNVLSNTLPGDSIILVPGVNRLVTGPFYIPPDAVGQELLLAGKLTGRELYATSAFDLDFPDETIAVIEGPLIKIISTDLITLNPPYVNHGQEFMVSVSIENLSSNTVQGISVFIESENGSQTFAELHDLSISPLSTIKPELEVTASAFSGNNIVYKAVIEAPAAAVLPPDDNTISFTVQSPARIELSAELIGTSGGFVDYGQPFDVAVEIKNLGEAEAGFGEISLLTSIDFGVPDSSAIIVPADSAGEFHLVAPSFSTSGLLRLRITGIPVDRNTGLPAIVTIDAASISVVVEPDVGELVVNGILGQTPLIIEGTTRELFKLELHNNTENSLNIVGLKSIMVDVADKNGDIISPDLILSAEQSGFFVDGDLVTSGTIYENRLMLYFSDFTLAPGVTDTIVFRAEFNDNIPLKSFSLTIDGRDIRAIFVSGPRINQSVPVRGKIEDIFRISGNYVIVVSGIEESLMLRNNPFNPKEGPAEIAYILEEDTDIKLMIFTLSGEKLFERSISAGAAGAAKGQNYISWDGANSDGKTVLNGIYILVIDPGNGDKSIKIKMAVMQ